MSDDFSSQRLNLVCHHLGIFVRDMEAMSQFYTEYLGFQFEREFSCDADLMRGLFGIPAPSLVKYFRREDFRIEFFQFEGVKLGPFSRKQFGFNHWAILVDDKHAYCKAMKAKNIKVIESAKGTNTIYLIEDPEGNLIEVKEKQRS